jgi:hypothetical protein
MTENQQLQALLRLKRYEQPPSGYYEKLLRDVHRRQRSELLRRPLWSIAMERVQTFFSEHSMGNVSYAGAMAAVAVAGLFAIQMASKPVTGGTTVASAKLVTVPTATAAAAPIALSAVAEAPTLSLSEESAEIPATTTDELPTDARLIPAKAAPVFAKVRQPRYVIDSRPVSYEATKVSFSF